MQRDFYRSVGRFFLLFFAESGTGVPVIGLFFRGGFWKVGGNRWVEGIVSLLLRGGCVDNCIPMQESYGKDLSYALRLVIRFVTNRKT